MAESSNPSHAFAGENVVDEVDPEMDPDLALALKLSLAETEGSVSDEQLAKDLQAQLNSSESDRAVAEAFQNQLPYEAYVDRAVRPHEQSKVSVSDGGELYYHMNLHQFAADPYDSSDEDSEEEEYYDIVAEKAHRQMVKAGGKLAREARDTVVTKHDPDLAKARNARQVEKFVSTDARQSRLPNTAYNHLKEFSRRQQNRQVANKGPEDRATHDQVLDPKTRIALLKLINKDLLAELHGVISTGKEAVVYHALRGEYVGEDEAFREGLKVSPGMECAVKLYKVTLNEFKNRSRYLEGEWRFRHDQVKQNPRKLIKTWAEKEIRNLHRLQKHGVLVPTPYYLTDAILLMEFLGTDGIPAPKLKEVRLSDVKLRKVYLYLVRTMRKIYQECNLVHGDLSEYNILYFKGNSYIIDVSQAVETDHPEALAFLRSDCTNVTNFFRKRGIENALTVKQLFDFVTTPQVEDEEAFLEELQNRSIDADEDAIFANANTVIPRRLMQVENPFSDGHNLVATGVVAESKASPEEKPESN